MYLKTNQSRKALPTACVNYILNKVRITQHNLVGNVFKTVNNFDDFVQALKSEGGKARIK